MDGLSRVFMYLLLALMLLLVYRDVTRSVRIHRAINDIGKSAETNTVDKADNAAQTNSVDKVGKAGR